MNTSLTGDNKKEFSSIELYDLMISLNSMIQKIPINQLAVLEAVASLKRIETDRPWERRIHEHYQHLEMKLHEIRSLDVTELHEEHKKFQKDICLAFAHMTDLVEEMKSARERDAKAIYNKMDYRFAKIDKLLQPEKRESLFSRMKSFFKF